MSHVIGRINTYNTFKKVNVITTIDRAMRKTKERRIPNKLAQVFRSLGQPARVNILLAIGTGEACVCHLEAATGQRQAYISQQLMALRRAKLVATRRDGRNIFYRLKNPGI